MIVIKRSKQKMAIAASLRWQVMDPFGRSILGHKPFVFVVLQFKCWSKLKGV